MAKALSTQQWLKRAIAGGETRKSLANKLGRSPSTIGDILSGRRPGENIRAAARSIARHERTPIQAPPSKGRPVKTAPRVPSRKITPLQKGIGEFTALDRAGVDKVVINITRSDGESFTLGGKGGINADTIANYPGGVGSFISAQLAAQGYEDDDDADDGGAEDYYYTDYEFEEY